MVQIVSPPAVEVVTVEEARKFLKITHTHEDDLLHLLVEVGRAQLEARKGCYGIHQLLLFQGVCMDGEVRIPCYPFHRLVSMEVDGVCQSKGFTITPLEKGILVKRLRPAGVRLFFEVGYGATRDKVPSIHRYAILQEIKFLYDNPHKREQYLSIL